MTDAQRYLVTARKYRPQRFDEIVGQDHVSDTLKNALRLNRLGHAYLFSGPRGVGKTTAARILAKAVNCEAAPEARTDQAEPCRKCASCVSFEEGRNMNIIEIDAASNNKVDDIRELRETVRVPPQGAKKKIYIVDEVHMLSTSAFNALLKTLEEPPPYALFIFATTEPHKVLPTITSRCQRFDFRRLGVVETMGHLAHICAEEGVEADEEALRLIARKGDGALRDALSAFDQAVSLCGSHLTYDVLANALGVVQHDFYFRVTEGVAAKDSAALIRIAGELMTRGYDVQEFLIGLQEHVRHLLVARITGDATLLDASESFAQRYRQAASGFEEPDLLRLLMLASEAEESMKTAAVPRLRLELTLLKMAHLAGARDLNAALDALKKLSQVPVSRIGEPAEDAPAAPVSAPVAVERPTPRPTEAPSRPPEPSLPPPPAAPPPALSRTPAFARPPALSVKPKRPEAALTPSPEPSPTVVRETSPNAWATTSPDDVQRALRAALAELQLRPSELSALHHARIHALEGQTLVLGLPSQLEVDLVLGAAPAILPALKQRLPGLNHLHAVEVAQQEERETADEYHPLKHLERLAEQFPAVQTLVRAFDAEVVW